MGAEVIQSASDVTVSNVNVHTSVFDIFWNAGFIIKIVILTLLASSIWSWTIIISKHIKMRKVMAETSEFEEAFWSCKSLDVLFKEIRDIADDPMSCLFCIAMNEWTSCIKRGIDLSSIEKKNFLIEQIKQIMRVEIAREMDKLYDGLNFLSTVGTNGVIVGILGMVIGIMDGMKTIAIHQSVGMAAVAPIISESLFTTALGLFAAIPAAVAYNKINNSLERYEVILDGFVDEFGAILARQMIEQ